MDSALDASLDADWNVLRLTGWRIGAPGLGRARSTVPLYQFMGKAAQLAAHSAHRFVVQGLFCFPEAELWAEARSRFLHFERMMKLCVLRSK